MLSTRLLLGSTAFGFSTGMSALIIVITAVVNVVKDPLMRGRCACALHSAALRLDQVR